MHGHVAALLEEMKDVRSACLETARRFFGTRCVSGRVAWRPRCYGERWPNTCGGKRKKDGRRRGEGSGLEERRMTNTAAAA